MTTRLLTLRLIEKSVQRASMRRIDIGPLTVELDRGEIAVIQVESNVARQALQHLIAFRDLQWEGDLMLEAQSVRSLPLAQLPELRESRILCVSSDGSSSALSLKHSCEILVVPSGLVGPKREALIREILSRSGLLESADQSLSSLDPHHRLRFRLTAAEVLRPAIVIARLDEGEVLPAAEVSAWLERIAAAGSGVIVLSPGGDSLGRKGWSRHHCPVRTVRSGTASPGESYGSAVPGLQFAILKN